MTGLQVGMQVGEQARKIIIVKPDFLMIDSELDGRCRERWAAFEHELELWKGLAVKEHDSSMSGWWPVEMVCEAETREACLAEAVLVGAIRNEEVWVMKDGLDAEDVMDISKRAMLRQSILTECFFAEASCNAGRSESNG